MIDVDDEIKDILDNGSCDCGASYGDISDRIQVIIKALLRQQTKEILEKIETPYKSIIAELFQELDKLKWSSAFVASEFENNIKEIKEKYLSSNP